MRILITNDDGIHAPGLHALVRAVSHLGEVKVVAPDRERSACGHAMTLHDPLRVKEAREPELLKYQAFTVNGVPVDCVNVGLTVHWPDGCDLILSGINNGPNLGFDITYSGTVAGAMEGTINGIKSIAFSMANFVEGAPLHFETGEQWIKENIQKLINIDVPPLTFLNVNIPALAYPEIMGEKVTVMGKRVYEDRVEPRLDPWGRTYYWQGGVVVMRPDTPGTDVHAASQGYVSISPICLDWTNHNFAESLKSQF